MVVKEMPLKYKIERNGDELEVHLDVGDGRPGVLKGDVRDKFLTFCENLTAEYEKAAEQLDLEQRNDG